MGLYQDCSNYSPGVKYGPVPGAQGRGARGWGGGGEGEGGPGVTSYIEKFRENKA